MKWKKEDILDAIVKMRIERGSSTKTILKDFLMGELGFKQSYSYELLREARERIRDLYQTQNEALANEAMGHLESLYEDAIKSGNRKLALEIIKEKNKLTGLYPESRLDITSAGKEITEIKLIQITKPEENENG